MNIALFPSAFYPSLGGVEELTRQLAIELTRRGEQVMVVTERWPRDLPADEVVDGIPVRRFPMRVPAACRKSRLSFALTHGAIRRRIAGVVRRFDADVLHVQCVSSATLYALEAKRILGLPLVVTLQGELSMDAAGIFQRPGIAQEIMRRALAEADAITACSLHTLQEAETFFGQPFGDRGRVIHNGVNPDEFADVPPTRRDRPYALAIGRHVPQKGFDILLRAWALLGETAPDLVVAGDGPERPNLEALAAELDLTGRVSFPGRADRRTAAGWFKGCEFFVLPSRHEPFGIVNLEAMATGKAVVATDVGGVSEFVEDGETGLLAQPTPDGLATAIRRLLEDDGLRSRLAAAGPARARANAWQTVAEAYLDVYGVASPQPA